MAGDVLRAARLSFDAPSVDVHPMHAASTPLLELPSSSRSELRAFHQAMLGLLADAGCFHFVAENGKLLVRRAREGTFATLNARSLAELCDSLARFRHEDGREVPMPRKLASDFLGRPELVGALPYQWNQIRTFFRGLTPLDRDDSEALFERYCSWCRDRNERPIASSDRQFESAIHDVRKLEAQR